jgi:hypothetical protein
VELASRGSRRRGRRLDDTGFGLALEFFDGDGTALGTLDIANNHTDGRQLRSSSEFEFKAFVVPNDYIPSSGGFICVLGTDFTRLLAFGTTSLQHPPDFVPCSQSVGLTTSNVTDDTQAIPGQLQSYQQIGFGFEPADFTWNVQVPTFDYVNDDQEYPICLPDDESCCEADEDCEFLDDGCLHGVCCENECVRAGYCYDANDANGACIIYKEHNPSSGSGAFECGETGGGATKCMHTTGSDSACICHDANIPYIQGWCLDVNEICVGLVAKTWTDYEWACPSGRRAA